MSDGNYNRNLLPYHQYLSGLKAGKAQMRTLAIQAFHQWMEESQAAEAEIQQAEVRFREILTGLIPQ